MKNVVILLFTCLLASCEINSPVLLGTGIWGSETASLDVRDNSAYIQFTCASGFIPNAIVLDANDSFEIEGTYSRSSGTPPPDENYNRPFPAMYKGSLVGTKLTLSVNVDSLGISDQVYLLDRDNKQIVPICP